MVDGERDARCRFCATPLRDTFVDLGMSPLCETFPSAAALNRMEPFYPLHVWVCRECMLVQLEEYVAPEVIFDDTYPYFSSYSDSWVDHARRYVDMMVERFGLGALEPRRRAREQRRLSPPALREAGDPGYGCRADRQYGARSRSTRGSRRSCASSDPGRHATCSATSVPST